MNIVRVLKCRRLVLVLWIAAAIFPFGWLTVFSRDYARVFSSIFAAEAAHLAAHSLTFFGLACLLALVGGARALRGWRVLALWGVACAVALAQEAVQLSYKRRAWTSAESIDLLTDMAGALAGLGVARAIAHVQSGRKRSLL